MLHDAFARTSVPSASLWAAVPHYVAATPSPKAALALVERAAGLLETAVVTADLVQFARDYEQQVSEVVETDADVSAMSATWRSPPTRTTGPTPWSCPPATRSRQRCSDIFASSGTH